MNKGIKYLFKKYYVGINESLMIVYKQMIIIIILVHSPAL